MTDSQTKTSRCRGALFGMYIGDALAMPVHWYYDRNNLKRDYGTVTDYLSPRNPHADSELWKHHYKPPGPNDDILHDQVRYWGKRDIHYHQYDTRVQEHLCIHATLAVENIG
jgi:ADP-ribosylglycohydrolase